MPIDKDDISNTFFKVFGIKPLRHVCYRGFDNCIDNDYNCHCHNKKPCEDSHAIYPDITAEKLLEMICIYSKYTIFCLPVNAGDFVEKWTYEKLKNYILKELICLYKANIYDTNQKLQSNIQQLFKEEE